ncbi:hypothetical protein GCM10011386_39280 [Parapedobacter defluvii]|uniref:Uncharacterized protein n=2 Tax=Parapedobacter defluvii TaxID=2045106 RepID=A0ABQ1MMZ0_9SPHI|nr:hypothetical protein GCM10011386_39280 [Parapedobacter defluvii]
MFNHLKFTKSMEKQPLTPTGVQTVLNELYALPDEQLQQQARGLAFDFSGWISEHFTLTPSQAQFIENELSASFIAFVSSRVPFVMEHRLPITYSVFSKPPAKEEKEWGKIITTTDNVSQASTSELFTSGATGSFQFISRYYRK